MRKHAKFILIMGVTGSGKSSLGIALAKALRWPFIEGDDFHSPAARAKMKAGTPLNDEDRWPWLERIARATTTHATAVIACSALKKSYREFLMQKSAHPIAIVYLQADRATIIERLKKRTNHFMPIRLVESQFGILEPPKAKEGAHTVAAQAPIEHNVKIILSAHRETD